MNLRLPDYNLIGNVQVDPLEITAPLQANNQLKASRMANTVTMGQLKDKDTAKKLIKYNTDVNGKINYDSLISDFSKIGLTDYASKALEMKGKLSTDEQTQKRITGLDNVRREMIGGVQEAVPEAPVAEVPAPTEPATSSNTEFDNQPLNQNDIAYQSQEPNGQSFEQLPINTSVETNPNTTLGNFNINYTTPGDVSPTKPTETPVLGPEQGPNIPRGPKTTRRDLTQKEILDSYLKNVGFGAETNVDEILKLLNPDKASAQDVKDAKLDQAYNSVFGMPDVQPVYREAMALWGTGTAKRMEKQSMQDKLLSAIESADNIDGSTKGLLSDRIRKTFSVPQPTIEESMALALAKGETEDERRKREQIEKERRDQDAKIAAEERAKSEEIAKEERAIVKKNNDELKAVKSKYDVTMNLLSGKVTPATFLQAAKAVNRMVSDEALSDRELALAVNAVSPGIVGQIKSWGAGKIGTVTDEMVTNLKDVANRVYESKSKAINASAPAPAAPTPASPSGNKPDDSKQKSNSSNKAEADRILKEMGL